MTDHPHAGEQPDTNEPTPAEPVVSEGDVPRPDAPEADASDADPYEPTQPLAGWPAAYPTSSGPHPAVDQFAQDQPIQDQPTPYQPTQHLPLQHAEPPQRRLSTAAWLAVSGLALVLGLTGGVIGAGLVELAQRDGGRVTSGLDGVTTRESAPLDPTNGSVPAVAQALLPSTVQILADHDGRRAGATGSGFVLDREGHVVTNNHVVASAAEDQGAILVIDHSGVRHEATVVGRSPVYDLAVLAVENLTETEPAALAAPDSLMVGEPVVAFGAPLGLSQTVTSGIVSALDRPVTTSGDSGNDSSYINAVQTDAAINPGNSGGPLVNLVGEVVGVNSAIATNGGFSTEAGNIGVGFAIPIEQVRTTVDQILRTGKAEYPVIGATVRTSNEGLGVGAVITEVNAGTPADRSGLEKDDVVIAVADQQVTDGIALIVAIRTHRPGDEVEFTVLRDDEELTFTLTLDGQVG